MTLFKTSREKFLWMCVLAIFIAIFSTLFIGQPLARFFADQQVQAVIFVFGMLLVGTAILIHALQTKPKKFEIVILLGIVAVYIMLFLRLGSPERSHLFEYSVLALFIHKALIEGVSGGRRISQPALWALISAFFTGVLDECIQLFLPNRIFDPIDILFNGFVVSMAIGAHMLITWARKRINTSRMT
mgnify:CR=1 FL=1